MVGDGVSVNAWNWRPTLELLRRSGILPEEELELMSFNGGGAQVTAEKALRVAEFLDGYLAQLRPEERVTLDGAVTAEPDTGEFYRDDLARNYSATFAWLGRFRDFCRSSRGFEVF
jgi:hypothetical protein